MDTSRAGQGHVLRVASCYAINNIVLCSAILILFIFTQIFFIYKKSCHDCVVPIMLCASCAIDNVPKTVSCKVGHLASLAMSIFSIPKYSLQFIPMSHFFLYSIQCNNSILAITNCGK